MSDLGHEISDRYVILEELGSGGFATVYKARQVSTGQHVAMKVLALDGTQPISPESRLERFKREMMLCAELHHPNIVPLIDTGETRDGRVFVVFALVPGQTLSHVLLAEGALEPAEALHLMGQVIDAISCAHAKGIVHRDLKPQNIMLASTGARRNALVVDFGIGTVAQGRGFADLQRVTQTGEYVGTPAYSAPEQLRSEPPSLASDLYSWGLILIECLTGHPALDTTRGHEVVHRQLSADPVPLPVGLEGTGLGSLLSLVTQKDPGERRTTAEAVFLALQEIRAGQLPAKGALKARPWRTRDRLVEATEASNSARPSLAAKWLVPLGRNPNFVGREQLLSDVERSLKTSRLLAVVALHGLGGVGKTQLALEYVYRHATSYGLVAWIRAETQETTAGDYSAIATHLGLPDTPDQRQKVESVRSWLERNDRWLLVFDNAPNAGALRQYLPRSHTGHILVTSRHPSWRDLASSLAVDVLAPEDAASFVLRRSGDNDRGRALELSEELGRLPLALEEAAAYIETTGRTIDAYLSLLRGYRGRVLFGDPETSLHGGLRTTWELSFRAVEEEAPRAADLLKVVSFLAPDDVPYWLFGEPGKDGNQSQTRFADAVAFDACLATLRRYSFIKPESDSFSMHRLVQLATRERLSPAERERYAGWALQLVDAAYPENAIAGDETLQASRLLPHGLAALVYEAQGTEQDPVVAGRVLRRTGIYMSTRGLQSRARDSLERAYERFERAKDPDPLQVGGTLWELGMVLYALGEPALARAKLERGLGLLRSSPTPQGMVLSAQTLIALTWVLRTLGDFDGALQAAGRCRDFVSQRVGPAHPVVAMSLALIARAEWCLNRMDDARTHVNEALAVLAKVEQALPLIAGTWYTLAQVQFDLGDLEAAFESATKGRAIGERAYGRDHQLVAHNVYVLGCLLLRRGDLAGARLHLERALESGERAGDYLHEDVAMARIELANLSHETEGAESARTQLLQALAAASRVCEDRSRFEGTCRVALARVLRELGDLAAAERECMLGLRALEVRYDKAHPLRMPGLVLLAWVRWDQGEVEAAGELFAEAQHIGEAAKILAHPNYAESIEGVGVVNSATGNDPGARHSFVRALDIMQAALGPGNAAAERISRRLQRLG